MTAISLTGMPTTFLAMTAITMTMTESYTLVTMSNVTGMIPPIPFTMTTLFMFLTITDKSVLNKAI